MKTDYTSGEVTSLAMQLEACMLADDAAQARYLAIYGEPWISLSDLQDQASRTAGESQAITIVAKGTR